MGPEERSPKALIADGMLEPVEDVTHDGETYEASRLGYRITTKFVRTYLARVFDNPSKVFTEDILKPETQDLESYVDGVKQITDAQKKVADRYFTDGGYELACPPLKALLDIMSKGNHNGITLADPEIRNLFTRESLLSSDWYKRRLVMQKNRTIDHWTAFIKRLETYLETSTHEDVHQELMLQDRLAYAKSELARSQSDDYEASLVGALGADPMSPGLDEEVMQTKLA